MKPKRVKKKTVQFNVLVDENLFDQANKVRTQTWVEMVEWLLATMVAEAEKKK